MKAEYNHLYFPVALNHVSEGQFAAANECLQIALHRPLTVRQIDHLANTTVIWAMRRSNKTRAAELNVVLKLMASIKPQQPELARKIINRIHHAWAFESYTLQHWLEVEQHVVGALRTDPTLIGNRGLFSILARSAMEQMGFTVAKMQPDAETDCDGIFKSEAVRQRVEAQLGEPVQDWKRINSYALIKPGQHLYMFSDAHGHWIARQAVSGNVLPPAQIMDRVVQAGVPAPTCRIDRLADSHLPGLRVESFVEGVSLDLRQHTPEQTSRLMNQLGDAIRHMHAITVHGYGLLTPDLEAPGASPAWLRDQLELETLHALLNPDRIITPLQRIDWAAHALSVLDDYPYTGPALFCHGDMNPGNVLENHGDLAGLIDWELVQGGDPVFECAYFLTCTCNYWFPMSEQAFMTQMLEVFDCENSPESMHRANAYLLLCMLQFLDAAVRLSGIQPWRDAEKMRAFLLNTMTQRSLS